jgi:hypothetical protein
LNTVFLQIRQRIVHLANALSSKITTGRRINLRNVR